GRGCVSQIFHRVRRRARGAEAVGIATGESSRVGAAPNVTGSRPVAPAAPTLAWDDVGSVAVSGADKRDIGHLVSGQSTLRAVVDASAAASPTHTAAVSRCGTKATGSLGSVLTTIPPAQERTESH